MVVYVVFLICQFVTQEEGHAGNCPNFNTCILFPKVNIKSLEDVVRKYINLAEQKTEDARQESHQVVVDIDDLDQPDTPERYISGTCLN